MLVACRQGSGEMQDGIDVAKGRHVCAILPQRMRFARWPHSNQTTLSTIIVNIPLVYAILCIDLYNKEYSSRHDLRVL